MPGWSEVESEVPELAALARGFFDPHVHKTLATLRRDGSPRISGTESNFGPEGLWFGSMWGATKALDLQHDPRFALHSASVDPPEWTGDAKIGGRAEEITDPDLKATITGGDVPPGPFHLFRCDVTELVVIRVADSHDHLIIEVWHEGRGYTRRERR
jgi:hypothetical protein